MQKNNFINSIPFFADLPEEKREVIQQLVVEQKVEKGTIIFSEDDPAEAIYFVIEGKVRLTKSTPDGKEIILNIRRPGELFAEVALFAKDKATYPATAQMMETGVISFIRNASLEKLVYENPDLAITLIQVMGNRLRTAQTILRDVALYGKLGAFSATLLRLANDYGITTDEGLQINLNLTHQDLANFIGTSRENINRMVSDLKRNGILEMKKGVLVIKDMEKLKAFIE
ncbi:Crp/Fnr family transcriptional regulator [Microaerobacter geothermalis]|uniref:Crp/Fnr family transcriptional regulator n=1 Tax=Microaerobacter geothermalis TaxID=674972 RepID=UPI001F273B5B|nr:Crp/Fnr family transcriptional regulator [Microaerobacter geothermalis]MCF6092453.1 Crp/Fnr family transcriptional regulator [Microaerobacter geothermalis]